jgi:hypothetical protein
VTIATEAAASGRLSNSPKPDDQELGSIAFIHLLDQHPRRLTIDQLDRELGGGDRAALERVVAGLDEACLLQRSNGELIPSPVAIKLAGAG